MRRRQRHLARAANQVRRMAAELVTSKASLKLSDRELARRSGVARSTVRRVLLGDPSTQVDTLAAVLEAAGLDLVLQAFQGPTVSLRDTGQMEIADAIRQAASPAWRGVTEVAAGPYGRSADLVLYGPQEVIHVEIERGATDFQAQERSAKRKREALAAKETRPVRLVLALEDTRPNRAIRPTRATHSLAVPRRFP